MRKLLLFFMNNIVVNRFLILAGKDNFIKKYTNNWSRVRINKSKSLQENVGFSHSAEVDQAVKKIHDYVTEAAAGLPPEKKILDIGCGVGLYLRDFENARLYGTDLSEDFLAQCRQLVPQATLVRGDYLDIKFEKKFFDMIYSISVIEYIPPSGIRGFFEKIHSELTDNGVMLIQYPHALSVWDKLYSDLSYVSYLPGHLEKLIEGKFSIIKHEHSFDGRKIKGIDAKRYGDGESRNFCNGMILVAKKISA
jgi:SAM-dependent methyltransferase